ncbi:hypothetical protein MPTK1_2g03720 [Marchantia polymorpha subsp. ruderalis]|uniref:Uncharacterized protein n=2 Tax=Marchantia polymorpha TaxID=3197 RepID=A0A176VTN1_MARPO|nr:hypothetical protein AXG93_2752s1540 [Marchantia polymorpha subsp. ruderalis]PTQ42037.1 hypothetical protein MARPO_0031s0028 [Marchantia polymorpha]BBN00988.1 hypothetical protein Mp_2g03720 [Marchantia polymorpha subsp. ruderalis]|eukprot:PTQ42037.1 hypothetical protein MARPO_0031s0028 [Marchantia polymorpha]
MSKKNNKTTRARLHQFDLKREKDEVEKKEKKKQIKTDKLKVKVGKVKVGKKFKKGKLSEEAKAAVKKSAMEIDA